MTDSGDYVALVRRNLTWLRGWDMLSMDGPTFHDWCVDIAERVEPVDRLGDAPWACALIDEALDALQHIEGPYFGAQGGESGPDDGGWA
jgi:hypothetical protein